MTQPPGPQPRLDARGAIDLSGLGRTPAPPPGGAPSGDATGLVVDVTEAEFPDVVQRSLQVPVVFVLWARWSEASTALTADLVRLVEEYAGRFLLARVDAEASPQIAQAFQAQSVPSVVAVLKGQPLPLFQGRVAEQDLRAVLDQLLAAAAANGVTGTVTPADGPAEAEQEPTEPPLPPLHQEAYDAIERDDLDAAVDAYTRALAENPRDDEAAAGLAQVQLLRRTRDLDPAAVRSAAAADTRDVDAHLAVADLDVLGGKVEDAFARLLDLIRATRDDERERARVRLVELFGVVGDTDPRVAAARRSLASLLY